MGRCKRCVTVACSLAILSVTSLAQQPVSELSQCLQTGSATCLTIHMGDATTMLISGSQGAYSKTQADLVLKDFFRKNPPRSFKAGAINESHITGTLMTEKGNYRVFIALSNLRGSYQIQEIRIEP